MDPLSRKLNSTYPKVEIELPDEHYVSNHLLFIDDLKLFAENEKNLKAMKDEVKNKFFKVVGLEQNPAKSATNCESYETNSVILGVNEGYKYLGITENRRSEATKETYERVRAEILKRVEQICRLD